MKVPFFFLLDTNHIELSRKTNKFKHNLGLAVLEKTSKIFFC